MINCNNIKNSNFPKKLNENKRSLLEAKNYLSLNFKSNTNNAKNQHNNGCDLAINFGRLSVDILSRSFAWRSQSGG
jgi:hypothetical protein